MKALALIPARRDSKRIPGKNIKPLGNKPLICWTIEVAKQVNRFCDVLVSTDGNEIASISANAGALVPWLRPKELSHDYASSADVAIHALDWYERENGKVDALVLLQPTSPYRRLDTIEQGLNAFELFSKRNVVAVSKLSLKAPNSFVKVGDFIYSTNTYDINLTFSECDLEYYVPNGSLYITSPQRLRVEKSFAFGEIVPLHIDSNVEAIDIDTLDDWEKAAKLTEFLGI